MASYSSTRKAQSDSQCHDFPRTHLDFAPHRPHPPTNLMTTVVSDDGLFIYAEHVKGKVVLTGT